MTLTRNRIIKITLTPMKFFNNSSFESEKRISSTKVGAQQQENMIARHIAVQYFFVMSHSQMLGKFEYTLAAKF